MLIAQPAPTMPEANRLPVTTATKMKQQGWRGIMADVRRDGPILITNHNIPEAVILQPEQYDWLISEAKKGSVTQNSTLEALQVRFRERMKALRAAGANETLGDLMSRPLNLGGHILAGDSY